MDHTVLYKRTWDHSRPYQTMVFLIEHYGPCWTTWDSAPHAHEMHLTRSYETKHDHTGPSGTHWDPLGPYGTKLNHTKPCGTMRDHGRLYGTVQNHTGPYGIIRDHIGPFGTKEPEIHTAIQTLNYDLC